MKKHKKDEEQEHESVEEDPEEYEELEESEEGDLEPPVFERMEFVDLVMRFYLLQCVLHEWQIQEFHHLELLPPITPHIVDRYPKCALAPFGEVTSITSPPVNCRLY